MIMKNEKYIAPEMEVVDIKMNAVLMQSTECERDEQSCTLEGVCITEGPTKPSCPLVG